MVCVLGDDFLIKYTYLFRQPIFVLGLKITERVLKNFKIELVTKKKDHAKSRNDAILMPVSKTMRISKPRLGDGRILQGCLQNTKASNQFKFSTLVVPISHFSVWITLQGLFYSGPDLDGTLALQ